MSSNLSWRDALKQFNDKRVQEGGKYTIPKKGTPEYASVRELMGEKSDAVELKPNQTVTGKSRESSKSRTPKKTDSEEKIHKAVQTLVPTGDKPLWVDEPKPVEKKAKKEKTSCPRSGGCCRRGPNTKEIQEQEEERGNSNGTARQPQV